MFIWRTEKALIPVSPTLIPCLKNRFFVSGTIKHSGGSFNGPWWSLIKFPRRTPIKIFLEYFWFTVYSLNYRIWWLYLSISFVLHILSVKYYYETFVKRQFIHIHQTNLMIGLLYSNINYCWKFNNVSSILTFFIISATTIIIVVVLLLFFNYHWWPGLQKGAL